MKYVFFDIDGTIRGKSREITKRNREAICKLRENGHKAFLCTGRAPVSRSRLYHLFRRRRHYLGRGQKKCTLWHPYIRN